MKTKMVEQKKRGTLCKNDVKKKLLTRESKMLFRSLKLRKQVKHKSLPQTEMRGA